MQSIRNLCAIAQAKTSLRLCLCLFAAFGAFGQEQQTTVYRQKVRTIHTASEFAQMTRGRVRMIRKTRPQDRPHIPALRPLPYDVIKVAVVEKPPIVWIGTERGLFLHAGRKSPLEYFAAARWLPDDRVTGIGIESDDVVWIETPKGYSRIEYKLITLAEKSRLFVERIRTRHVRHGLTADSHLRVPGDLSSNQMVSSDNDGLWTQMYIAAEAFRHAVTKEAGARANAQQGFE